jgi:hypothetical protein
VIMALVGIACGITHHAVAKSGWRWDMALKMGCQIDWTFVPKKWLCRCKLQSNSNLSSQNCLHAEHSKSQRRLYLIRKVHIGSWLVGPFDWLSVHYLIHLLGYSRLRLFLFALIRSSHALLLLVLFCSSLCWGLARLFNASGQNVLAFSAEFWKPKSHA